MSVMKSQLQMGMIYSKMPFHRKVVSTALRDVEMALKRTKKAYVSNSWGKQSVVIAHLVFRVDNTVANVHWTGEDAELMANFSEIRDEFLSRFRVPYTELVRGLSLRDAVSEFEKKENYDGYFLGLCAYESKGRSKTIANQKNSMILRNNGLVRSCPIGNWSEDNLCAYIAENNLPMLSTYHKFGLAARTSTGARHGSFTERAVDFMSSRNAAILNKRMEERENECKQS